MPAAQIMVLLRAHGIIPIGPAVGYARPHDRDRFARRN
jgi:hypothetical protein